MGQLDIRTARLGPHVSEGLRLLWRAVERNNWSHRDLAKILNFATPAMATKLLHADRPCGLKAALVMQSHPEIRIDPRLWSEPPKHPIRLRVPSSPPPRAA